MLYFLPFLLPIIPVALPFSHFYLPQSIYVVVPHSRKQLCSLQSTYMYPCLYFLFLILSRPFFHSSHFMPRPFSLNIPSPSFKPYSIIPLLSSIVTSFPFLSSPKMSFPFNSIPTVFCHFPSLLSCPIFFLSSPSLLYPLQPIPTLPCHYHRHNNLTRSCCTFSSGSRSSLTRNKIEIKTKRKGREKKPNLWGSK